jgi:hypothetical protein
MVALATNLWDGTRTGSLEHFDLLETETGFRLQGTVVLPVEGTAGHIVYGVDVDDHWRTVAVAARIVSDTTERSLDVRRTASGWTLDGDVRDDMAGAVDIDLGWTPATNTLPIRRLRPPLGERVELTAAWIAFPERGFEPMMQAYTNLGGGRWLYESTESGFTAQLAVDAEGVVTHYDGLFETRL